MSKRWITNSDDRKTKKYRFVQAALRLEVEQLRARRHRNERATRHAQDSFDFRRRGELRA